MAQAHLVIKSFKDIAAATPVLANALPGWLRHGKKVDTSTPRPYGMLVCEEQDRVYNSGGGARVRYNLVLTIVGENKVGVVGNAQDLFAAAFNMSRTLPSVEGRVLVMLPRGSTLVEDKDIEHGKDILVGTQTWDVLIQESELILA